MYGRQTESAIACVSRLAEVHDENIVLSAAAIATNRKIAQPTVAKVLSVLSQAGTVVGMPGPGGGFRLAYHPRDITLYDVYSRFEREAESVRECPFGGGICGSGEDHCPLHDHLFTVHQTMDRFLHETTFDVFREAYKRKQKS